MTLAKSNTIKNNTTDTKRQSRLDSIDILRGIVILIMIIDHTRERFFMHVTVGDPINEAVSTELYLTRYLTHLCAPIFIFLAGLSAWLYANQSSELYRDPSGFLIKRGLFIILIEVLVYNTLWIELGTATIYLQVLWAIGVSMIMLGLLSRLNHWLIGGLGFIIVFGHNALSSIDVVRGENGYILWSILQKRSDLFEIGGLTIRSSYPVLSWMGVIFLGYFAGPLYARTVNSTKRQKILILLAIASLTTMFVLRFFNIYGETIPWAQQTNTVDTLRDFFNFSKYPASLHFILTTLAIGLVMLAGLDSTKTNNKLLSAIKTIGSVPMLAYILHLYALFGIYWICYALIGPIQGERFGLNSVWQIWLGALCLTLLIYYPLKAFAKYKHKHKSNKPWLSYL
jgi:uncharacterized membrane protein